MERVFIKSVGRFEAGEVKDYPPPTWGSIAESIGENLDDFTQIPSALANELFRSTDDGTITQGNAKGSTKNKGK